MKPAYLITLSQVPVVGCRCAGLTHPSDPRFSGERVRSLFTSEVIEVSEDLRQFETQNSIYLVENWKKLGHLRYLNEQVERLHGLMDPTAIRTIVEEIFAEGLLAASEGEQA
jgi:hypothetical protein